MSTTTTTSTSTMTTTTIIQQERGKPFAHYFTPEYHITFTGENPTTANLFNLRTGETFTALPIRLRDLNISNLSTSKKGIKHHLKNRTVPVVVQKGARGFQVVFSKKAQEEEGEENLLPIIKNLMTGLQPVILEKEDSYNKDLCCPLTLDLFNDPVVDSCGHTFERSAIEKHLENNTTCPLSRQTITKKGLSPNLAVKNRAAKARKNFPVPLPASLTGKKIEKSPEIAKTMITLAQTFAKKSKMKQALKHYKQALEYTDRSEDYAPLIQIYQNRQEKEKIAFSLLVLGHLQLRENKPIEAKKNIEKALSMINSYPKIQEIVVTYYKITHQSKKAFDLAAKLANTFLSQNNEAKATEYFEKALTIRPGATLIYEQLEGLYSKKTKKRSLSLTGMCHFFSLNNLSQSEHFYKRAKTFDIQNPLPLQTYLSLLDKNKESKKVRNLYRELIDLSERTSNLALYAQSLEKLLSFKGEMGKHVAKLSAEVFRLKQKVMPPEKEIIRSSSPVLISRSLRLEPEIPKMAFGPDQWLEYFGDVGKAPSLPKDIDKILSSPCIFWPNKTVAETHLLVLIPSEVDGKPLTLNSLQELIQKPKKGHKTDYSYYYETTQKEIGNKSPSSPYWALVTKEVIPNSRSKTYSEQRALIKGGYVVPGALEIATGILMHHVQSGEKLYPDSPNTYTRCQEVLSNGYRVFVGSFGSSGLGVYSCAYYYRHASYGLGLFRKF